MGRNRRRRQGRSDNASKDGSDDRRPYVLAPKENKLFEEYYQGQGIVPTEEWNDFMDTLRQPLPSTIRITGFRSHAKEMLRILKQEYTAAMNVEVDGRVIQPAKCLSWYPGELAWQLDLARKMIRQDQTLKKLHRFLVQETESGNISRQETVSMIPPLVLDVQPDSKVLDMCAAPGSKTAQLIEFLHADDENGASGDGFVVANDNDNKRCYLMVHQLSRLLSSNFAVTNMDAANLPKLLLQNESGEKQAVKFDRILCDVPCSGDGTLRKNVDAWAKWNPAIGHGLHNLQVRILRRGVEMLAVGGRIVYSTCSFNPVENEAVVAAILRRNRGTMELVDISDRLPGLVREPGRHAWKVMSKQKEWFEKYEDIPERLRTQITPTSFPPTAEEAEDFKLERCIRILPHKQDTGGFFVAVLERKKCPKDVEQNMSSNNDKIAKCDNTAETPSASVSNNDDEVVEEITSGATSAVKRKSDEDDDVCEPMFKKVRHYGYKEDPFIFLKQDDEMWTPVRDFFGISPEFPFSQLMVRCETGKKRNIYFVSPVVRDLVQQNENKFKFINLGVKILSRSVSKSVECEFRLVQDGLHILYPYITKRIVQVVKDDVVTLLSSENPYITRMSAQAADQLNGIDQGGCVFVYKPEPGLDGPSCRLLICGWKGKVSCRSFIPKSDRGHFLRLCGVELTDKAERTPRSSVQANGSNPDLESEKVAFNEDDTDKPPTEFEDGFDPDDVETRGGKTGENSELCEEDESEECSEPVLEPVDTPEIEKSRKKETCVVQDDFETGANSINADS